MRWRHIEACSNWIRHRGNSSMFSTATWPILQSRSSDYNLSFPQATNAGTPSQSFIFTYLIRWNQTFPSTRPPPFLRPLKISQSEIKFKGEFIGVNFTRFVYSSLLQSGDNFVLLTLVVTTTRRLSVKRKRTGTCRQPSLYSREGGRGRALHLPNMVNAVNGEMCAVPCSRRCRCCTA